MSGISSYTRRNLELRAAKYYASIRKPESEWKTIKDIAPQLNEFEHHTYVGNYAEAYRLLNSIDSHYLYRWGHYTRLAKLRENLLGHLEAPIFQAYNLSSLGNAYRNLGQVECAIKFYKEALMIFKDGDDHLGEGDCLIELGLVYRNLGQVEQAIACYKQALGIVLKVGDHSREGLYRGRLGSAHLSLGQFKQAITCYEASLDLARKAGDRRWEGVRLGSLGRVYYALGQVAEAIELCQQALEMARVESDRRGEQTWLSILGFGYQTLGQVSQALHLHGESLSIAREINDCQGQSYATLGLGKAYLTLGEFHKAQQCCEEALTLNQPDTSYQASLVLSIVLLNQHSEASIDNFTDTISRCYTILNKTADLYKVRYTLATALVGQAVCDPRWSDPTQRPNLLASALTEYRRALDITAAPGVMRDALHDLELIHATGIEGLEPAFALLEAALNEQS